MLDTERKIFSLVGCAVYGFIHWAISILLLCKFIIKTNKIAHSRHVRGSAKIIIARGPYTTKKRSNWELFFVLNMAIGRSFDRINFEIISPVFDIT